MAVMLPDKWSQLKLPSIGKADPAEQERLLKLFWNRAELKKELQGLDDQLHNLRNKLKQQENANSAAAAAARGSSRCCSAVPSAGSTRWCISA